MAKIIIAESGGTKTDWCMIRDGVVEDRFETFGLHPFQVSDTEWDSIRSILSEKVNLSEYNLHFYGAGCYNERGKLITDEFVKGLGVREYFIFSDLDAAGKATLCDQAGWVAIMGTGSVLFYYKNGKVVDLIGGKGYKDGDEGSGFYFGKLLWESYNNNSFNSIQREIFEQQININDIRKSFETGQEKPLISKLSERLSGFSEIYEEFHEKNLKLFYNTHILEKRSIITNLCVSGSYGFYHEDLVRRFFSSMELTVDKVIRKPIDVLIEQTVALND